MALFYYHALHPDGQKQKGMIEADSARHARQLLRGRDLLPLSLEERVATHARHHFLPRRPGRSDLALFTRQLATLIQAALPLEECLLAVSEQCEKLAMKSLALSLRSRIQQGYTLSESLREHPQVFDTLFCAMVASGEKSSRLDQVLNRLADHTEQRQRMQNRLLQAALYPLILMLIAAGVVAILLTVVVPGVIEQFAHLGAALPTTTRLLITLSDSLHTGGLPGLALLCALLAVAKSLLRNARLRLRWDGLLLRLPVVGRVIRELNTARFARTLSILTASSVPLLDSLHTAARVSSNRYVEQQLLLAADHVREGSNLRTALAESHLFPPMMLYMIASGERSGELEQMLSQAAENQDKAFDMQVGMALGVFEPALIVTMAGVVLFIVTAILQPMLQLNTMMSL